MTDAELAWVAGIVEGEGCISWVADKRRHRKCYPYPRLSVQMCDLDIIERVHELVGGSICYRKPRQSHHKDAWTLTVSNEPAARLLWQLRPWLGIRRSAKVDAVLALNEIEHALRQGLGRPRSTEVA